MEKRHLPRLVPEFYRGHAFVHWTPTIEDRATGWLNAEFHSKWIHILLHASSRYCLICPAYMLMPDHVHLFWLGRDERVSDQRAAIVFLRKNLKSSIAPAEWQRQPQDHVLTEVQRAHDAFQSIVEYILQNPVRAGLVSSWHEYPYCGCCVPGYPELSLNMPDYWERFWRCYNYLIEK